MKKIYLLTLAVFGFWTGSFGQSTATATATATIVTPISIANNAPLSFGNIAVNETNPGGTVMLVSEMDGTVTRTSSAGVTLPTNTGTVSAAQFTVTGEGASIYSITLPGSITLTGTGGDMSLVPNCSQADLTAAALTNGSHVFYIGGTLTVATDQPEGIYSGTFDVSVNYN